MHTHAEGFVRVRPRPRERARGEVVQAVEVTLQALTAHLHMPMYKAARCFGIGVSSLKKICRRLGLECWPHSRKGLSRRGVAVEYARSRDITGPPSTDEGSDLWFLACD